MSKRGFMPCFSMYRESDFPIENIYKEASSVEKVKKLINALIDSENPFNITREFGIGKEIQAIRPDSGESKRLIKLFGFNQQMYRIDYGNTPFRVIFGVMNSNRQAYILAFDTKHLTFKK